MKLEILIFAMLLASISFAHIDGTAKTAGDYRIEFSVLDEEIIVGNNVDIAVALENATGARLPDRKIWLRVSSQDALLLSLPDVTTNENGVVALTYMFPRAGSYTADIGIKGSSASFDLTVESEQARSPGPVPASTAIIAAVFLLFGIVIGIIIGRRLLANKK